MVAWQRGVWVLFTSAWATDSEICENICMFEIRVSAPDMCDGNIKSIQYHGDSLLSLYYARAFKNRDIWGKFRLEVKCRKHGTHFLYQNLVESCGLKSFQDYLYLDAYVAYVVFASLHRGSEFLIHATSPSFQMIYDSPLYQIGFLNQCLSIWYFPSKVDSIFDSELSGDLEARLGPNQQELYPLFILRYPR